MSSRCPERRIQRLARLAWAARLRGPVAALLLAGLPALPQQQPAPPLRVCTDPDSLPYSHADGSGFEDRIAALLAQAIGRPLLPQYMPLRRGFVRKTVGEGLCDVFIGVPAGMPRLGTTRPYYRSRYVFVTGADDARPLQGFDDPRLAELRIGVQLVGNDLAATPPGHALARHGALAHVVGFTPYAAQPAAQRMLAALQAGTLDAALVWGPQAGYFAARAVPPLRLTPATPPPDLAQLPFDFAIAVGVRPGDTALRDALQVALDANKPQIDAILAAYQVPRETTDGVQP